MKYPTKVPVTYVAARLSDYLGAEFDDNYSELRSTLPNTEALASLSKIKSIYFRNDKTRFEQFKQIFMGDIPDEYWLSAIEDDPATTSYCKRWMKEKPGRGGVRRSRSRSASPSGRSKNPPKRRRPVKIKNFFGSMSDEEADYLDDEQSAFVIQSSDNDPNLPMPICRGIRRSCRNYDDGNRYVPFEIDDSEDKDYIFDVSY